jgi:hypothetical protein
MQGLALHRERVLGHIEARASALIQSGETRKWLHNADPVLARISESCNLPLLHELAEAVGFDDPGFLQLLTSGAPCFSALPVHGEPSVLLAGAPERNRLTLASLREDCNSQALWDATMADVELGRMARPVDAQSLDLSDCVCVKRFAVVQGPKTRPVDDGSAAGVNEHTTLTTPPACHTVDHLHESTKLFRTATGELPAFYKVDLDSAFRRVPLAPDQRRLCTVVFRHAGSTWASMHHCCCFGFTASVDSFDRVGAAIRAIVCRVLRTGILRYVDDMFACEFSGCVEHAAACVVRLIRVLMGPSAVSDKKVDWGDSLVILGLQIQAGVAPPRPTTRARSVPRRSIRGASLRSPHPERSKSGSASLTSRC